MAVSRRTFVTTALAVPAAGAVFGTAYAQATSTDEAEPRNVRARASEPGDVVGKITTGYQGWFAAAGDGSPIDAWWHWAPDMGQTPSPSNNGIISWPDMRDYETGYQTDFPALGNGQPATLFSSHDDQTVDTHFRWMAENSIHTAALQRFNPNGHEGPTRDAMTEKVRAAAEAHGVRFYVMYDITDWLAMREEITVDWTEKMSAHTESPEYARQNGKPVVGIWGPGFADEKRPFTPDECLEVIRWFQDQGCYVMGGVPTHWRSGDRDSRPGFEEVYLAFDMLSPWMVGRLGTVEELDAFYESNLLPDQRECDAAGIDYQPCVMPGNLQEGHRAHGDFMWRMFYNTVRAGAQGLYISMFDEYNEGNQIAKTAETSADVPAGEDFLALDEDGTPCSADYYLRLTGDGGRMLAGEIELTETRPTPPVV
ncbi:glycoside hydrolase family 71/99-like protein [Streptomyces profundus]|uniref:glycoside hydrolase family 71/99-like protein n=1 Tax=Streptomyces profundus TaxID=2867410 RepID=UPI001D15E798|nr:glycoside hydrolase family 71/99-like protein [Streptomyces sp. MA3_2.13]UED84110.1 xylosidase [Streptomyces sp. MA3_2.13]